MTTESERLMAVARRLNGSIGWALLRRPGDVTCLVTESGYELVAVAGYDLWRDGKPFAFDVTIDQAEAAMRSIP